jgi:hypothetical protein
MNDYSFQNAQNTSALRSGDQASVPWNPEEYCPLDMGGEAGRIWVQDGSPFPAPYIQPPEPEPEPVPTSGDAVAVQMQYKAMISLPVPSDGYLRWGIDPAQNNATIIMVAGVDTGGIDQSNFWRTPSIIGRTLFIQLSSDADQMKQYTILEVTEQDSYFNVRADPIKSSGGEFVDDDLLYIVVGSSGAVVQPSQSFVTQEQFSGLQAQLAAIMAKLETL